MITVGPQLFACLLYAVNSKACTWLIHAAFHRHQQNRDQQKPIDKRIRCGNKSHAASKTAVLGQPHTSFPAVHALLTIANKNNYNECPTKDGRMAPFISLIVVPSNARMTAHYLLIRVTRAFVVQVRAAGSWRRYMAFTNFMYTRRATNLHIT